MCAGNQASRLMGRKRDKLWGRKREVVPCMIIYSFIPHSENVRRTLSLIHSSQSTGGPFMLFVAKLLCVFKPVKILIIRQVIASRFVRVCACFGVSCLCMDLGINSVQWGLFWSVSTSVWLGSAAAAYWNNFSFDLLPFSTNLGPSHPFHWYVLCICFFWDLFNVIQITKNSPHYWLRYYAAIEPLII